MSLERAHGEEPYCVDAAGWPAARALLSPRTPAVHPIPRRRLIFRAVRRLFGLLLVAALLAACGVTEHTATSGHFVGPNHNPPTAGEARRLCHLPGYWCMEPEKRTYKVRIK